MFSDARNRQVEENECGLACLGRAAARAGSNLDLRWLRERWSVPAVGLTLPELEGVARQAGFATQLVTPQLDDLQALTAPCILLWKRHHFVLLERYGRRSLEVFDPARGPLRLRWPEVAERFGGAALQLTATEALPRRVAAPRWPALWRRTAFRGRERLLAGLAGALLLLLLADIAWPAMLARIPIQGVSALLPAGLLLGLAHCGAFVWRRLVLIQGRRKLTVEAGERIVSGLLAAPLEWAMRRRSADLVGRIEIVSHLGHSCQRDRPSPDGTSRRTPSPRPAARRAASNGRRAAAGRSALPGFDRREPGRLPGRW